VTSPAAIFWKLLAIGATAGLAPRALAEAADAPERCSTRTAW